MNIFILEDDPIRIEKFESMLSKHKLTITTSAAEAIKLINANKYDYLLLDHDLGGKQMVDSRDENTGYAVAKAIKNSPNADTKAIIHSFNPIGAGNMKAILPHAKRMPFGTFGEQDIA
jgi:CheY-like chemotaxis protein